MVYTVTFNPSLDYIVKVEGFQTGKTNRTSEEKLYAGGKGINVAEVLAELGVACTALYFSAGFVGKEITRRVSSYGIHAGEIELSGGCSRINVKLSSGEETEINGMGPDIDAAAMERLWERLKEIGPSDYLVLAGSIPNSLPRTVYSDIMKQLAGKTAGIVVDATGDLLLDTLRYRPFLIKPNQQEIEELFGVKLSSREQICEYAVKLRDMGAQNVIVSLGEKGAVFAAQDGLIYTCDAPKGKVTNAVGAGDSLVAGFLSGHIRGEHISDVFKLGVCTGSATAFAEHLATKEEVMRLYDEMKKQGK